MLPQWLRARLFPPPPAPRYENVEDNGAGYYRYNRGRWRRVDFRGYDEQARWLSLNRLMELKLDWVASQRWRKKRKVKIL